MATFIRIGKTIINADMISYVSEGIPQTDGDPSANIHFRDGDTVNVDCGVMAVRNRLNEVLEHKVN